MSESFGVVLEQQHITIDTDGPYMQENPVIQYVGYTPQIFGPGGDFKDRPRMYFIRPDPNKLVEHTVQRRAVKQRISRMHIPEPENQLLPKLIPLNIAVLFERGLPVGWGQPWWKIPVGRINYR